MQLEQEAADHPEIAAATAYGPEKVRLVLGAHGANLAVGRDKATDIEGIGPIGAMSLYATLGSGDAFSKGREASAYVGLTPRQFSSGGKANIVGLSKYVGNRKLRSVLIQGALAYVYRMKKPRSTKDRWLEALIERAGPRRAAVALANKNVRTAWALIAQGTDYQRRPQLEMAA